MTYIHTLNNNYCAFLKRVSSMINIKIQKTIILIIIVTIMMMMMMMMMIIKITD